MFDKDRRVVEARVDRYSKARKEKHSIEDETSELVRQVFLAEFINKGQPRVSRDGGGPLDSVEGRKEYGFSSRRRGCGSI